ncbi:transcriptional regulator [Brevibacillus sp. DP1.3A]|uniref:transcriptional regulator n=1 Tax=Brevibacillus sp. DP1.3A TaxID=2738867 RepID=UPI00156B649C|nr:transcriptional regulator [Brevibacillus sp. DP1.3A]UED78071.1 transcriptional regulator [Brevibacillus sp. DP1.3A]
MLRGLGKKRSKLGQFIDSHHIDGRRLTQEWLVDESKVSRETISKLCSDTDKMPAGTTMKKILQVLRKVDPHVKQDDFWSM